MTPGPTIILKCPDCSKSIEQSTIGSGNTFGATFWTDGKREVPMLPDQPWLIKCPHCKALLWIDELEEIARIEPWDRLAKFKDAIAYEPPSMDDYIGHLEKGVGSPDKEHYVRLRLWWDGNDARRACDKEIPFSSQEESNLIAFAEMLDEEDPNALVMKAEVMRELGRFDDARALLARSADENLSQAVKIIENLVAKDDRYVREMVFE
jgi:hypothetical protein